MRKTSVVQVIVAATLVLIGGLALAFACEGMQLQVIQKGTDEVKVVINGETQAVALKDLADGQEKTFAAGEHKVTVKRTGDRLELTLDGNPVGKGDLGDGEGFSWVEQGGEGSHRVAKKMIFIGDDDAEPGERSFQVQVSTDDTGEGEAVKVIRLDGNDLVTLPAEVGVPARVVFRCQEDGTVVKIAKDKATQDSYTCPVCGRAMTRTEAEEVRILTFVTEDDKSEK
jgi:hypothetical protein